MKETGVALIMVLLVTSVLSTLALGLAVIVSTSQLAEGNFVDSMAMLYAAEAGVELAAHDLSQSADWDLVLSGRESGTLTDGAATGVRNTPAGGRVSLTIETNQLNCGKASSCTEAQMNANSRERPWGPNNARWRLFEYGSIPSLDLFARPGPWYLLVWVADDGRETDGNPLADGGGTDHRGRGILRVRAEVYGGWGARRAVEAELARSCRSAGGAEVCQPGIRVQSWQELRQLIP
jgi:hypothetical protein